MNALILEKVNQLHYADQFYRTSAVELNTGGKTSISKMEPVTPVKSSTKDPLSGQPNRSRVTKKTALQASRPGGGFNVKMMTLGRVHENDNSTWTNNQARPVHQSVLGKKNSHPLVYPVPFRALQVAELDLSADGNEEDEGRPLADVVQVSVPIDSRMDEDFSAHADESSAQEHDEAIAEIDDDADFSCDQESFDNDMGHDKPEAVSCANLDESLEELSADEAESDVDDLEGDVFVMRTTAQSKTNSVSQRQGVDKGKGKGSASSQSPLKGCHTVDKVTGMTSVIKSGSSQRGNNTSSCSSGSAIKKGRSSKEAVVSADIAVDVADSNTSSLTDETVVEKDSAFADTYEDLVPLKAVTHAGRQPGTCPECFSYTGWAQAGGQANIDYLHSFITFKRLDGIVNLSRINPSELTSCNMQGLSSTKAVCTSDINNPYALCSSSQSAMKELHGILLKQEFKRWTAALGAVFDQSHLQIELAKEYLPFRMFSSGLQKSSGPRPSPKVVTSPKKATFLSTSSSPLAVAGTSQGRLMLTAEHNIPLYDYREKTIFNPAIDLHPNEFHETVRSWDVPLNSVVIVTYTVSMFQRVDGSANNLSLNIHWVALLSETGH
ncbi:hypothetical protein BDN67DRAFT_1013828 [Paxillus ammoniavirescens]|nr:hypothetical protein BDN67DRAFT_1013828 [Paxillus ammoniavirescens]